MLLNQIQTDLKQAQLVRDEIRVSTLRLLLSEIHNIEIAKSIQAVDQDIIAVIQREAKKRKEAAMGFRSGSREESALKEEAELKVLESYLPPQISNEELTKIIDSTISETGAAGIKDVGKVMSTVMGEVKGGADGGVVSALVKERLTR